MYLEPDVKSAAQLDRELAALGGIETMRASMFAWSRTIREAIGMPVTELARRMGVSQPTATIHEQNEAKGSISIERLEALATALDCELVYGFIPRTPLEGRAKQREAEMQGARSAKRK